MVDGIKKQLELDCDDPEVVSQWAEGLRNLLPHGPPPVMGGPVVFDEDDDDD